SLAVAPAARWSNWLTCSGVSTTGGGVGGGVSGASSPAIRAGAVRSSNRSRAGRDACLVMARCLEPQLYSERNPLRPEAGLRERKRRLGWASQGAGDPARRHLLAIDARIDLVAGSSDIAPVQERVAGVGAQVPGHLVGNGHPDLGHHGKRIV